VGSLFSSARVRDNLLLRAVVVSVIQVLPGLRARVRRCVLASAVRCTRLALHLLRADVRRWVRDVPAWEHVRVVRRVLVVCLVQQLVHRLREPRLVLAPASARPRVVPVSVIQGRAASRKGR